MYPYQSIYHPFQVWLLFAWGFYGVLNLFSFPPWFGVRVCASNKKTFVVPFRGVCRLNKGADNVYSVPSFCSNSFTVVSGEIKSAQLPIFTDELSLRICLPREMRSLFHRSGILDFCNVRVTF